MSNIKRSWLEWKHAAKYENPLYKEYLYLKDRAKAWWKARQLRNAKRLARARHLADGKTYYVLPDDRGRPRAFNSREIEILKAHGLMSKRATCVDLYKEAIWIANARTCGTVYMKEK